KLTLDRPLEREHLGAGEYRGEVADLSRSVVVESADLGGVRGHTMYHRNSAGSVSYAEFRHLGKEGVLGKYALHFHLCGDTRRGKRLPKQILPFDQNEGAGFWWANSLNTFTRNVAAENGQYGFRFEATPGSQLSLVLPVPQPDGGRKPVDVRTLPFIRFEGNE